MGYQRFEINKRRVVRFTPILSTLDEAMEDPWEQRLDGYSKVFITGPTGFHCTDSGEVITSKKMHELLRSYLINHHIRVPYGMDIEVIENPTPYMVDISPLRVLHRDATYVIVVHWPKQGRPVLMTHVEFYNASQALVYMDYIQCTSPEPDTPLFKAVFSEGRLLNKDGRELKRDDALYKGLVGIDCLIEAADNWSSFMHL
jgi:hypothetical protein